MQFYFLADDNNLKLTNSRFLHDVTAAMFVHLNKETVAIFVSPPNPPGIELYYYASVFFVFFVKHGCRSRAFKPTIVSLR